VDFYTRIHFQFGVFLRSVNVALPHAVLASVLWEWIIEPHYKETQPELFPAPSQDSVLNRVFDTVAVAGGWYWANRERRRSAPRKVPWLDIK
jgi:hypothetical protein